jgi:hypothetical protein
MYKKILGGIAILSIAAVTAFNVNFNSKDENLPVISLKKVEALALKNAGCNCDGICDCDGTGNTGPGQVVDCGGWGTGTKKICLCTNQSDCTESSCS